MDVLEQHQVTDGQTQSTDWTTIGTRILEAATLATAIHLEMCRMSAALEGLRDADLPLDCELFDVNGM